jgi:hypothetical protein
MGPTSAPPRIYGVRGVGEGEGRREGREGVARRFLARDVLTDSNRAKIGASRAERGTRTLRAFLFVPRAQADVMSIRSLYMVER